MTAMHTTIDDAPFRAMEPAAAPRPVLVATDGREVSAPAMLAARLVAGRLEAPVRVVSVVPQERIALPTPEGMTYPGVPVEAQVAARSERVRDEMRRVLGADVAWPLEVRAGVVPAELADVAHEMEACVVVTGLVRHGRLDRLLRGETPLAVLDEAGLPVLAVPAGAERLPRTVLVAVDASDATLDAATFARPLLAEATTVYLVHVRTQLDVAPPMMASGSDQLYHERIRTAFQRVTAALELAPAVHVETMVVAGETARELLDFADAARVEMIVTGHRRRPLVERFVSRGTATRLFHGAATWLLMVPEDPRHRARLAQGSEAGTNAWLRDRTVWQTFLEAFTSRNFGRRAALDVYDHLGAQTVVIGYPFLGIDYEREGAQVDLMLGDPAGTDRHLRHTVRRAVEMQLHRTADGQDAALRVSDGVGQVLLTFRP